MIVNSSSGDIDRCLRKLERQLIEAGGWLHKELEVKEEEGGLAILSPFEAKDQQSVLMMVPEGALIPCEDGFVGIRNDEFYLKDDIVQSALTPARHALFETMLELYNLTGKIADHRRNFVYFACGDDEETFHKLTAARSDATTLDRYREAKASRSLDQFLADSFFHSRVIAKWKGEGCFLMPFIDFANYHPWAAPFGTQKPAGAANANGLKLLNSRPVWNSNECFVYYGPKRRLRYFSYLRVCREPYRICESIPMTISLEYSVRSKQAPLWEQFATGSYRPRPKNCNSTSPKLHKAKAAE